MDLFPGGGENTSEHAIRPKFKGSMYGLFTNISHKNHPHEGKYTKNPMDPGKGYVSRTEIVW